MFNEKAFLSLDIFDYSGNKICSLFNSKAATEGQAQNVVMSFNRNGWKEISFVLPGFDYRAKYLKSDFKIRALTEKETDWYIINEDTITHNAFSKNITVKAGHICGLLKTKNLSLEFSDDYGNNTGTCAQLLATALEGTGWTVGDVATFYEKDGTTEKVRSYKCSTKTGSFKMVSQICELFEAKPVYNGDSRTVDALPMNPFSKPKDVDIYSAVTTYAQDDVLELHYGTDLSNVARSHKTDNLITKLYAYGAWGDTVNKYCGIEECTHRELTFTLSGALTSGSTYWFSAEDEAGVTMYRNFTPTENVASSSELKWSWLDRSSLAYIFNPTSGKAYRVFEGQSGTELPASVETEECENMFAFIMDFDYYLECGLISDDMLAALAIYQYDGAEKLAEIRDKTLEWTEAYLNLSQLIGQVKFAKLDVESVGSVTVDDKAYATLTLSDDKVIYRTDADEKTKFKFRKATHLKDNGDSVNEEASVLYIIHNTDPVTYDRYYLKDMDDVDDPELLTVWCAANKVSLSDQFYIFDANSVNGYLGAYEVADEACVQTLDSQTTSVTVKHPVFFAKTAPAIESYDQSAQDSGYFDGITLPSWSDFNKSYAWWYKYYDNQLGELYFCYWTRGDRAWKRVYIDDTEPTCAADSYWFDWKTSKLYSYSDGTWVWLDNTDDEKISTLFGTVYASCLTREKYWKGQYEKYTLTGTFEPNNWYMPDEYGAFWCLSTQQTANKFEYDTQKGFCEITPTASGAVVESVDVKNKRFDNVLYHAANIFEGISIEEGSIDTNTGGDVDAATTYRTTSVPLYPNLVYNYSGITGAATLYFYTLKHDYIGYANVVVPCTYRSPANTRYVRVCSAHDITGLTAHIPEYETAIIAQEETYYLAGTPVGSGRLKGLKPMIADFADAADGIYITIRAQLKAKQDQYKELEEDFKEAFGELYREGYMQKSDYVEGDESRLYDDAYDALEELAKPECTYNITFLDLEKMDESALYEVKAVWPEVNQCAAVHLVDPEISVNCWAYIDKIDKCYDKPWETKITINTNLTTAAQHSFGDILTNIATVANEVRAKDGIYDRAAAISGSGTFTAEKLEGTIDANALKITGGSSTWYTDPNGNMVFESADGQSAMTITGNGFAISSAKDKYGDWIWRSFGDGRGFTADEIITGTLSAKLIEAGSITTDKISSTVGQELDITSNKSVNIMVSNAIDKTKVIVGEDEPENPELNRLWVDTSTVPNLEKRYVGLNIWDEVWEDGAYDTTTGEKITDDTWKRTKNAMECEAETTYYFHRTTNDQSAVFGALLFYDSNGDLISYENYSVVNTEFTTPAGCTSMAFYAKPDFAEADISINDHSSLHEYIPYSDSPWMVVNEVDKNPAFTTLQSDFNVAAGKITSIVSEVWPNGDMTASSRIDQTADKISLVVEDGSSVGNVTLTADALSYIGPNISLTQNGDFVEQSSNITANADKIALVVADGSTVGNVTLTADALSYVGNNVNLQTNNSLNIIVGNIESDITNAANTAQGNAQSYADGVASTISATQDEMKLQIAAQGDVLAVMKLEGDGLWVQTGGENSPYKTLTDGTGFHVYQQDTRIASFANNGITAHSFTMGRVVCRKTSAGGWAWNLA